MTLENCDKSDECQWAWSSGEPQSLQVFEEFFSLVGIIGSDEKLFF